MVCGGVFCLLTPMLLGYRYYPQEQQQEAYKPVGKDDTQYRGEQYQPKYTSRQLPTVRPGHEPKHPQDVDQVTWWEEQRKNVITRRKGDRDTDDKQSKDRDYYYSGQVPSNTVEAPSKATPGYDDYQQYQPRYYTPTKQDDVIIQLYGRRYVY